jgi:anthranilate phosphoribosyltransferase
MNIIENLLNKQNLDYDTMQEVMHKIMQGECSNEFIAAFLVAMQAKGITSTELLASVNIMQKLVTTVKPQANNVVDVVGTGGDGIHTFNISTASMIVAASCGAKVAKHGNRGVSSHSGSADALEALGVNLNLTPTQIAQSIDNIGLGFMFAPQHHTAMKYVLHVRKILGIRTFFNVLGPLTNPANVKRMLLGVYSKDWLNPIAEVLQKLEFEHAWIVCAKNGMDEISTSTTTHICEIKHGKISNFALEPSDYGFKPYGIEEIYACNALHSAQIIQSAFGGERGAAFDIISINAGATLYLAGIASSLKEGIYLAQNSILSKKAKQKLQEFIHYTQNIKIA